MIQTINWENKEFSYNRVLFRKEVVNEFLKEMPGIGRGVGTTKYEYTVKLFNNYRIYLKRPAQFNNGFDFTLNVENWNFNSTGRKTTRPTHQNILDELSRKKLEDNQQYYRLYLEIECIFNCCPTTNQRFTFTTGLPTEILLECIKWLFLEQDVTYWNYSGRQMFFNSIKEI